MVAILTSTPWWEASKEDVARKVFETFKTIDEANASRRSEFLTYMRQYEGRKMDSLDGSAYAGKTPTERLAFNVSGSIIDTRTAKLSTNRTRFMIQTFRGDWGKQIQARGLTRFTDGLFLNLEIYGLNRRLFRDGDILGTSGLRFYVERDKIKTQKILADEIGVDEKDGRYGEPRSLFLTMEVSKSVLAKKWPKLAKQISESGLVRGQSTTGSPDIDPTCAVVFAWHLPSDEEAHDGRHVVALSTCPLVDREWELPRFPVAIWRPSDRSLGFWGKGSCEQLYSIQKEIDFVCQRIQDCINLGTTVILDPSNGQTQLEAIKQNVILRIIKHPAGMAPQVANLGGVPPEYFTHLERLIGEAYNISGVSQMSAMSLLPPGLTAGVAQREHKDTESQRFLATGQDWEDFHLLEGEIMIDLAGQIAKTGKAGLSVMAKSPRGLDEIRWKDVDLDRDQFVMQKMPASFLPRTPAYRLQMVTELAQAFPQLQPYVLQLTEMPDIDAVIQRLNAPLELAQMVVESILYDKNPEEKYTPPDAFHPVKLGLKLAHGEYCRAKIDGCPPERLALLRRYIGDLQTVQSVADAGAQQMADQLAAKAGAMAGQQLPGPVQTLPAQDFAGGVQVSQ
jgi:hypothetical protein